MGLMTLVMIIGFKQMASEKGINMTWWKWVLTLGWWMGFLLAVAVPFTFVGEGEPAAGAWMILFSVVPASILGLVVWRVVTAGPKA
jgi:hypothetical protein